MRPFESVDVISPAAAASWGSLAEWATVAFAAAALAVSLWAFRVARGSERKQLFVELHDRLTGAEAQLGRRLLHTKLGSPEAISRMFAKKPATFDVVNRTVGLYNTLGIYAHRGYLDKDLALDQWAGRVRNGWPEIERFLRWRREQSGDPTMWSYLIWFAQQSAAPVPDDLRLRPGWDRPRLQPGRVAESR